MPISRTTRCSSVMGTLCYTAMGTPCSIAMSGLPDSPRGWWKEQRDTLQGDSWTSLKRDPASFCLRDCSGHLIGMNIVHVDDILLATGNSHQAESHISRLLSKYDIKDVKRADDDGGVLYCGKRVRSVPDDMKPGGLALQQDQMEFVKARCEPASMSRVRARQEGDQCTPGDIQEMRRSMTGSLHWVTGGTRPDEAFATSHLQRKQSAPLVSDHKRAVQTTKRLRGQSEVGLRCGPPPTKMCVLVYTDSGLHNADADPDEEGSDAEWLAKAKQKGVRVRSQHGALVCVVAQDDLEKTEANPRSFMTWKSNASKRTILSTFVGLFQCMSRCSGTGRNTRAMLCEVVLGGRVLLDEWGEEHMPERSLTVRACLTV